jgi:hypothetical protein
MIYKSSLALIFTLAIICSGTAKGQNLAPKLNVPVKAELWTDEQLIAPDQLAAMIKTGSGDKPVIFNIGAVEDIQDARHIGPVNNAAHLEAFTRALNNLSRNAPLIIYCGCCPFTKCPNIRPAFAQMQKMGFSNIKLLNLETNLKTNWIAKGYPMAK